MLKDKQKTYNFVGGCVDNRYVYVLIHTMLYKCRLGRLESPLRLAGFHSPSPLRSGRAAICLTPQLTLRTHRVRRGPKRRSTGCTDIQSTDVSQQRYSFTPNSDYTRPRKCWSPLGAASSALVVHLNKNNKNPANITRSDSQMTFS